MMVYLEITHDTGEVIYKNLAMRFCSKLTQNKKFWKELKMPTSVFMEMLAETISE
jgi:hypothetical protein